jgi:hypothetical protein
VTPLFPQRLNSSLRLYFARTRILIFAFHLLSKQKDPRSTTVDAGVRVYIYGTENMTHEMQAVS